MPDGLQTQTVSTEQATIDPAVHAQTVHKRASKKAVWILGGLCGLVLLGFAVFSFKNRISFPWLNGKPQLPASAAQVWTVYHDEQLGFSLSYPETWKSRVVERAQQKTDEGGTQPVGSVEFEGKEGKITLSYGNGFLQGSCSFLGGTLETASLLRQPADFCRLNIGALAGRWDNTCGDCTIPEKDGTTYRFVVASGEDDTTDKGLLFNILTTFTFDQAQ